jgi:hypothetical protein
MAGTSPDTTVTSKQHTDHGQEGQRIARLDAVQK